MGTHSGWCRLRAALVVALAFALCLPLGLAPGTAAAGEVQALPHLNDEDIPGKLACAQQRGNLTPSSSDSIDVFRIFLHEGQPIHIQLRIIASGSVFLNLYGPQSESISVGDFLDGDISSSTEKNMYYTATEDGWHYVVVFTVSAEGHYELTCDTDWNYGAKQTPVERLWGNDRYSTAVDIAAHAFPGWRNIDHVIIASGEDRAAADPLAASGLVWTYGGPLLLVNSREVPPSVMAALKSIHAANGGFKVHVVGGPVSVPEAVLNQISAQISGLEFDRISPYSDRYTLAASIADRMWAERPDEIFGPLTGMDEPLVALIANGENPDKFFDALSLSPLSARTGWPILLVGKDVIPGPTQAALDRYVYGERYVAGGPNTVSDEVLYDLGGTWWQDGIETQIVVDRWSGQDRYETARKVMEEATEQPYGVAPLTYAEMGVAAKLPDALTGGACAGLHGGGLLITRKDSVPWATHQFLSSNSYGIGRGLAFGGANSIADETISTLRSAMTATF